MVDLARCDCITYNVSGRNSLPFPAAAAEFRIPYVFLRVLAVFPTKKFLQLETVDHLYQERDPLDRLVG